MKVEMAVLGSPSLIVRMVSVDVNATLNLSTVESCVKVKVDILIIRKVSVDVKQH